MRRFGVILLILIVLTSQMGFTNVKPTGNDGYQNMLKFSKKIVENHKMIRGLTEQAKTNTFRIKHRLTEVMKNPDDLTEEELSQIVESMTLLQNSKTVIDDSIGDIKPIREAIKEAKDRKAYKEIYSSYRDYISIQNNRINELRNLNKGLADLMRILRVISSNP